MAVKPKMMAARYLDDGTRRRGARQCGQFGTSGGAILCEYAEKKGGAFAVHCGSCTYIN